MGGVAVPIRARTTMQGRGRRGRRGRRSFVQRERINSHSVIERKSQAREGETVRLGTLNMGRVVHSDVVITTSPPPSIRPPVRHASGGLDSGGRGRVPDVPRVRGVR